MPPAPQGHSAMRGMGREAGEQGDGPRLALGRLGPRGAHKGLLSAPHRHLLLWEQGALGKGLWTGGDGGGGVGWQAGLSFPLILLPHPKGRWEGGLGAAPPLRGKTG